MEKIREFDNKLLKRKEVVVREEFNGNPGFAKSTELIAKEFKTDQEKISVKKIESGFGSNEFTIEAFIYDSKEQKDTIEPKKKEKKGGSS